MTSIAAGTPRPVWPVPARCSNSPQEVRNLVNQLDQQFPFWLFFLSKRHLGLRCLLFCFLPPFLAEGARARIFPERTSQLLSNRWLPAMSQMCQYVGFWKRVKRKTDRDDALKLARLAAVGAENRPEGLSV
jgi:hypothetical protein